MDGSGLSCRLDPSHVYDYAGALSKANDLPMPVISKLSDATDALREVLLEAEGFRGRR